MSMFGYGCLIVSLVAAIAATVLLAAGQVLSARSGKAGTAEAQGGSDRAAALSKFGRVLSVVVAAALFVCCAILVYCFFAGDYSILYVLQERSLSTSNLAWLYKLSGLWAGRAGSLMFWAFIISLFVVALCVRARKDASTMDNMAILVMNVVLLAFLGVLVFSESNMPFTATPASYFNSDGSLTAAASMNGMNSLLEHWAMAIHPPVLFVGYAGMAVPFAYAIATLIVGDSSAKWVERSSRFTLFSWLFLGAGIGLGAVWAYVVLGWGGYWGWDPVENASLLSWLVGVALIHTFTVYRQRGAFKRWAVMCACLAFAFVIVDTFISRSGIVQSVHAFEGDPVSLALFGSLIALAVLAGIVGLAIRWKQFDAETEGGDDVENMVSKDAAYYFNNVIMIVFTLLLTYMTVSSALPSWLPFGGQSLGTTSYDSIARPLGIVYLFILAVCPLLAWGKTDPKKFFKQAKVPGICALALFAVLLAYYVTTMMPAYFDMLSFDNSKSAALAEAGPSWYYVGLSVVGLFVASLLFFNALFMIGRGVSRYAKAHKTNVLSSAVGLFRNHAATYGGALAHVSMAIILVGLIGSSMYVTEKTGYLPYDSQTDTSSAEFTIQDYTLKLAGTADSANQATYTVSSQLDFDVYRGGEYVGQVHPSVQQNVMTQQQKLDAGVISFADEDLFVVYRGLSATGSLSLDVRVNPLISLVWFGFGLLMVAIVLALAGHRGSGKLLAASGVAGSDVKQGESADAKACEA